MRTIIALLLLCSMMPRAAAQTNIRDTTIALYAVQASYAQQLPGGGNIFSGSVAAGFGDIEADGFNVVATLGVRDNKALRGDQRDFVNTFQPDRGLSVDTRGTPFATIFPFAGSLFPNAAAFPPIPGTNPVLRYSGGINVLDLPGQPGCEIDGKRTGSTIASKASCPTGSGPSCVPRWPS